jgi:hypothetical protein
MKHFTKSSAACYSKLLVLCNTSYGPQKAVYLLISTYIYEQALQYDAGTGVVMARFLEIHAKVLQNGNSRLSDYDFATDLTHKTEAAVIAFQTHNKKGLLPDKATILQSIPGVGSKIANCTLEMAHQKVDAAAVDRHGVHTRYLGFVPPTDTTVDAVQKHLGIIFSPIHLLWFNRTMGGAGQIIRGEIGADLKTKFILDLKTRSETLGVSWCIENWLQFGYDYPSPAQA